MNLFKVVILLVITFEQKEDFKGAQNMGGAIFNVKLDRSHPINFGFKNDELAMFRRTKIFIKPYSISYNNPIKYTDTPLLRGYISKQNLEKQCHFKLKKWEGEKLLF